VAAIEDHCEPAIAISATEIEREAVNEEV